MAINQVEGDVRNLQELQYLSIQGFKGNWSERHETYSASELRLGELKSVSANETVSGKLMLMLICSQIN